MTGILLEITDFQSKLLYPTFIEKYVGFNTLYLKQFHKCRWQVKTDPRTPPPNLNSISEYFLNLSQIAKCSTMCDSATKVSELMRIQNTAQSTLGSTE